MGTQTLTEGVSAPWNLLGTGHRRKGEFWCGRAELSLHTAQSSGDRISVRGDPMTEQVYTTQGDSSCLQNKWTKLFFSCAFAHSANTALTLTKPSTQFPKSKLPSVLNFQLLLHFFSLHFCSFSLFLSHRGRPSAPHGLIFYTHAPTLKNPLGHMIHHLFKPCHVPGFLCSCSFWCKSLVP